jgi:hypothetical protein
MTTLRRQWEIMASDDLNDIISSAQSLGWEEKKVQVRRFRAGKGKYRYYIEPFEDCSCPNVLRYDDYFVEGKRV